MSKIYAVQIELPDTEHLQYIEDLTALYTGMVETKVCSGNYSTGSGVSVTLTGEDINLLSQLSNIICNRIKNLNHIDRCTYFSFGFKYWISYIKRIINRTCYEIAFKIVNTAYNRFKKDIEKKTFRYLK